MATMKPAGGVNFKGRGRVGSDILCKARGRMGIHHIARQRCDEFCKAEGSSDVFSRAGRPSDVLIGARRWSDILSSARRQSDVISIVGRRANSEVEPGVVTSEVGHGDKMTSTVRP